MCSGFERRAIGDLFDQARQSLFSHRVALLVTTRMAISSRVDHRPLRKEKGSKWVTARRGVRLSVPKSLRQQAVGDLGGHSASPSLTDIISS